MIQSGSLDGLRAEFLVGGVWIDSGSEKVPKVMKMELGEGIAVGAFRGMFESGDRFVRLVCRKCGREATLKWVESKGGLSPFPYDHLDKASCICEDNR
jgi:hypothetical protein